MKSDKLLQFIIKLIKLTRTDEIKWSPISPSNDELPNGEYILDKMYETTFNERDLRLFRYKYRYYKDEFDFEWLQRIRLELLDSKGNVDYEFEYMNSLSDLYDIIREQTSEVLDFIDDVLGIKLEILEAQYYTAKFSKDITKKLIDKVVNNRLVLDATNEIDGDPEFGEPKKLRIKYKFSGEILEKEVEENQTIIIP